jgi:hypothetical protein
LRPLVEPKAAGVLVVVVAAAGLVEAEAEAGAGADEAVVELTVLPQRRSEPEPVLAGDEEAAAGVEFVAAAAVGVEVGFAAGAVDAELVGVAAREVVTDGDEAEMALL